MYYPWTCWGYNGSQQESRLSVVTEATGDVVALADAKTHLRVEHSAEDTYIQGLIAAAAAELDTPRGWLGRTLLTKTLRLTLDEYPPTVIYLPGPPIQTINSVEYRDRDGVFQTLDPSEYEFNLTTDHNGLFWIKDDVDYCPRWPTDIDYRGPDLVRIEYDAGYGTSSDIPHLIKQWILIRVGDLYRDRESSVIGASVSSLDHVQRALDNWRVR
jgi:uncharacterized phiE125 gp8 family phage protein